MHPAPCLAAARFRPNPPDPVPTQALLTALFHGSTDGYAVLDDDGGIRELNAAGAAMFGLEPHEARGKGLVDLLLDPLSKAVDGQPGHWPLRLGIDPQGGWAEQNGRRRDGNPFPVSIQLTPLPTPRSRPYLAVLRDLTHTRAADEAIALTMAEMDQANRRYQAMLDRAAFAIVLTDAQGRIETLNPAARALLGLRATAVLEGPDAARLDDFLQLPADPPEDRSPDGPGAGSESPGEARWPALLAAADHVEQEVTIRRADGSSAAALLASSALRDGSDRIESVLHIAYDISARREQEAQMRQLAYTDPLTGLGNRALLEQELEATIGSARRQGRAFALLFIDLDRFKPINDTHGHAAGDAVLREIAARLQGGVRLGDLVCRIGGDEFVVLLPAVREAADGERVAAKLRQRVAEPIVLGDLTLAVGASVGVVLHPEAGSDVESLMHAADLAMYRAKQAQRAPGRYIA